MSPPLTYQDHLDLLDCIHELHSARLLADFPAAALRALARVLPSTLSAFNEINLPRNRTVAIFDRPITDYDRIAEAWQRYNGQHPTFRYTQETGDGQALKISDFLSEDEYHRLDLYRHVYREMNAQDQFSIVFRSDRGVMIALAFNRARRDFTESDRLKLNLVRPHLIQAYTNLEELSGHLDEKADLQTALRETGHGVIAVDDDGRAAHATPGADDCLARYFPVTEPLRTLPEPIVEWLHANAEAPFIADASDARLIVRSPRDTERRLLLLSEERHRPLPRGQRLTARESEVLRWLADGKANAEIATILGVTPGTVKLHVEHILTKLGVQNRTAAAVFARDAGLIATKQ